MANIGLSKPYYAIYTCSSGTVTYSNGGSAGKAVSASIEVEGESDNNLYADNGIAESAGGFANGTLTLGIDELRLDVAKALLGLNEVTEGTGSSQVTAYSFRAGQVAPYVGVGMITKKQIENQWKWLAVFLPKCQFEVPSDAYETQGETITFNTPELNAKVLRDDTVNAEWKRFASFDSEESAESYIKGLLDIT